MSDATTRAKALLKAVRHRKCGHGSSYTCGTCEARIHAEVWFEGSGFTPATLAVAITLAEALRKRMGKDGHLRMGTNHDECEEVANALAEWEGL
jgi:hypothetical protein